MDITPGLIYKWQQHYQVKEGVLQPSEERAERAELRRLRRELELVKQERDILKKSHSGVLAGGVVSRYRFIAQQRGHYAMQQMCAVFQVSVSGFYDWLKRKPSPQSQANTVLSRRIRQVHEHSHQTYGYLRVHVGLCANGERVGKHRVARLMRQMGLQTKPGDDTAR